MGLRKNGKQLGGKFEVKKEIQSPLEIRKFNQSSRQDLKSFLETFGDFIAWIRFRRILFIFNGFRNIFCTENIV